MSLSSSWLALFYGAFHAAGYSGPRPDAVRRMSQCAGPWTLPILIMALFFIPISLQFSPYGDRILDFFRRTASSRWSVLLGSSAFVGLAWLCSPWFSSLMPSAQSPTRADPARRRRAFHLSPAASSLLSGIFTATILVIAFAYWQRRSASQATADSTLDVILILMLPLMIGQNIRWIRSARALRMLPTSARRLALFYLKIAVAASLGYLIPFYVWAYAKGMTLSPISTFLSVLGFAFMLVFADLRRVLGDSSVGNTAFLMALLLFGPTAVVATHAAEMLAHPDQRIWLVPITRLCVVVIFVGAYAAWRLLISTLRDRTELYRATSHDDNP